MAIRFNKLIQPGRRDTISRVIAEQAMFARYTYETLVFMSHKTGDIRAEDEARYISDRHGVQVYMAEWDDSVDGDSNELPDYIMNAIRECDGFLVNVIAEIVISMWIGYEIGGAHAMQKPRAKIYYDTVYRLPSVVRALESLRTRYELDQWIIRNILKN